MKRNDNEKPMGYHQIIRIFTSASKYYDYLTDNLNAVVKYLKDKPIWSVKNDDSCCISLYVFFDTRCQFRKYKKDLEELIGNVY